MSMVFDCRLVLSRTSTDNYPMKTDGPSPVKVKDPEERSRCCLQRGFVEECLWRTAFHLVEPHEVWEWIETASMCPRRGDHEISHGMSFLRSGKLITNKRQSTMEINFCNENFEKNRKISSISNLYSLSLHYLNDVII